MKLNEFKEIIKSIGAGEITNAILEKLDNKNKHDEFQNILNSQMRESVCDILIQGLPEKFDNDRFDFVKK